MLYEEKYTITYYDLDSRGQIKLSALLKRASMAAELNGSEMGVGFTALEPLSMAFVLQRFGLDIDQMPVYGQTVCIYTWPGDISKGTFLRHGSMLDCDGKKMMEWTSLWVLFNLQTRRILRPSALPVPLLPMGARGVAVEAQKVDRPDGWGEPFGAYRHTVHYSDIDTNKHMNNIIYGDLISNVLYMDGERTEPLLNGAYVQINYRSETRLGDDIDVVCRRMENQCWITGTVDGKTAFSAVVVSKN